MPPFRTIYHLLERHFGHRVKGDEIYSNMPIAYDKIVIYTDVILC